MKAKELAGMSDDQLAVALTDTEKHLFQLRFQSATDRLETPSEIRKARKDIARIKTAQHQRALAKLAAAPADELARMVTELEPKTEGPGKRRAKRQIQRLTALREALQPKAPVKVHKSRRVGGSKGAGKRPKAQQAGSK